MVFFLVKRVEFYRINYSVYWTLEVLTFRKSVHCSLVKLRFFAPPRILVYVKKPVFQICCFNLFSEVHFKIVEICKICACGSCRGKLCYLP